MTTKEIVDKIGIGYIKLVEGGFQIESYQKNTWLDANISLVRANKAAIIEYVTTERARAKAENEARWAAQKAEQDAIDLPLLDAMNAELAAYRAQIPAGSIEVTVTKVGDSDGYPRYEYTADGVTLNWSDVTILGNACAVRPGCGGAFAEAQVACINREKLEEIRTAQDTANKDKAEKRAAREKKLTETPIPQDAIEAYNRYHGDADKAWEREDETAWAIIRKWTPYIEAQRGMDQHKMANLLRESIAEANYGIKD